MVFLAVPATSRCKTRTLGVRMCQAVLTVAEFVYQLKPSNRFHFQELFTFSEWMGPSTQSAYILPGLLTIWFTGLLVTTHFFC